jgi:hypothetical protein
MEDSATVMSLLLILGILVTLFLVLVLRKRKLGKTAGTDYKAFFIMGVVFLPTGLTMMFVYFFTDIPFEVGLPIFALGLIYLVLGLAKREKWKKST